MTAAQSGGFAGRREVTAEVLTRLEPGSGHGALLVGEPGTGKTALLKHIVQRAAGTAYVIQVRGSAGTARMPFGALTFLLADLDAQTAGHPVLLLRGLMRLVRDRAAGRPVILAVDNADELDDFSAMALSQLVSNGGALLLAAFRDFGRASGEFVNLWREGRLARIDLGPLSVDETAQLLCLRLGGTVSRVAVLTLAADCGGNPLLLGLLCEDYRESGRLRNDGGIWVLLPRGTAGCPRIGAALDERLAGLTEAQRDLLDTVALAGSLPLPGLWASHDAADLDTLQEVGLLAVSGNPVGHEPAVPGAQPAPAVSLASPVMAEAARARIGADRRRALYQGLDRVLTEAPHDDAPHFAEWTVASGGVLTPEAALRAARTAVARRDPAAALRLIREIPPEQRGPAAALELARALTELGDYPAALETLESLQALESLQTMETLQTPLTPETAEPPTSLPARLNPGADAVRRDLVLMQAEFASDQGRYADNALLLTRAYPHGPDRSDPDAGVQAGSWLCEAWAMTGRVDDALELAAAVDALATDPAVSAETRARAFMRITHMHLSLGGLDRTRERLNARRAQAGTVPPAAGSLGELADGLLYAHAGQPEQALGYLVPALRQLQADDPKQALPLAAAATAYCLSLQGDTAGARELLPLSRGAAGGWKFAHDARYFAALAAGTGTSAGEAAAALRALAEEDRAAGNLAYELRVRWMGLRLGDHDGADTVLQLAASQQGDFARLCETYAKGKGNGDAQLLLQAADAAQGSGHVRFGQQALLESLDAAGASGDRALARLIQRKLRGGGDDAEGPDLVGTSLASLTARERLVAAKAAAGASNKDIAADLGVSVRTIEGHLYQLYAKLHVADRRGLAALVTSAAGAPR